MGATVCVTGASGYIASWLVKLLLRRGYTVRATVRDLGDSGKIEHLKTLQGADQRLHLIQASLTEEGSFDSAVRGCEYVFHLASPVLASSSASDPQRQLVEPAVNGTLNVLKSCAGAAPSVKRVILTASISSVIYTGKPSSPPDVPIDETWHSDPEFCASNGEFYPLSKTLAEQAAWKFSSENDIDLVTIHPGFVIGPVLQPYLTLTPKSMLKLITEGKPFFPTGIYRFVDVRDVATAHILAAENPEARGRYCVVSRVIHSSEALAIVKQTFPSLHLPPMSFGWWCYSSAGVS
ncbi:hypothetical protein M569_11309 [Genlisea aurea]|uniref:Dihydroflavonol 4-reductase n=1 Tax=Genlisea aurea TaxID=192259 RepID=S8C9K6_9LAMI|nr:hypothetical protein M569_11309 [Genlisea aurea]